MGLETDFHEMFYVPEPSAAKKARSGGPVSERQRVRAAARGRDGGRLRLEGRLEQLQMQQFNAIMRGADKPERLVKGQPGGLKQTQLLSDSASVQSVGPPFLELNCNPSNFSVFAAVRQSVLESRLRKATFLYNQSTQGIANDDSLAEETDDEKTRTNQILKVPKVVGLGLCTVFELIRESRINNPSLCSRALHALLDSLQGQVPESLKKEPPDVTDPLFDMLLDLATTPYQPDTNSSDSPNESMIPLMKSFACSALLSLVVALGDTGKMLTAVSALLTSSHLGDEDIETPNILIAAQRSVHAVLLGKTNRPDWLSHGFPGSALCDSFPIFLQSKRENRDQQLVGERSSSLAFDGRFLYLLQNNVIFKVGSGYGGTVKGQVVLSRRVAPARAGAAVGWLGWVKGYLYYQANNWTKNELTKLDTESLHDVGKVTLGISHWGPSVSASDGDFLIVMTAGKDDTFSLRTLKPSTSSPLTSNNTNQNNSNSSSSSSSTTSSPAPSYLMPVVQELTLKLAHKCLTVSGGMGTSLFEPAPGGAAGGAPVAAAAPGAEAGQDQNRYSFKPIANGEEEAAQVCTGKDFAVIRTLSGKVLFTGKGQSIGMKHSVTVGRWSDLPVSKGPKIAHISVGHDSSHLLLVSEDGAAYFCGLAKRGEDGEQSKGRRQPKASKPKRMSKMEGKYVVNSSCNHGTSALVTKNGELFLFGKDSTHVDKNTGLVSGLKDVHICQVALGKAHTLVVTDKGQAYAFGFNHKGQCGQDFVNSSAPSAAYSALGSGAVGGICANDGLADAQVDISEDVTEPSCSLGNHSWKYDQCMICTSCGECTGYGQACVASGKSEVRNPGMPCGCGAGDSGCADCGTCRSCDKLVKEAGSEEDRDGGVAAVGGAAAGAAAVAAANPYNAHYYGVLGNIPESFDLAGEVRAAQIAGFAENDPLQRALEQMVMPGVNRPERRRACALEAHLNRKFRHLNRAANRIVVDYSKAGYGGAAGANGQLDPAIERLSNAAAGLDELAGSDCEAAKLTSLPPTKLVLPVPSRVVQVACGLHHSVLLLETGEVYTFGSNQFGQLGLGDFSHRERPAKVNVHSPIVQIATGSNHTVLLSGSGQVFTFGSNQKNQLGRLPSAIDYNWNASPYSVPNIGPQNGRRATWIDASGDYTFVKLDESLINPLTLHSAKVVANSRCVVISPPNDPLSGLPSRDDQMEDRNFRSLVINRADGSCRTFTSPDQLNLGSYTSLYLDSIYDVLWTFDAEAQIINRFNIIASEAKVIHQKSTQTAGSYLRLPTILSPEVALPNKSSVTVSRSNAAFNVLCALHTLTSANQLGFTVQDDEQTKNQVAKTYNKDDFLSVNRFESHGGGWGYSGHSIEAIRFMADADILLGGFGLFGGRGEYMAKLRVYDIGVEGGEQESDGDILAETEETPYECGARQKFPILFDEPVALQANRWYVAWARVSGPSSDCGSSGQALVNNAEDQVTIYFKSSKKSNNGTDVNAGQIPLVLYKLATAATDCGQGSSGVTSNDSADSIVILSREYSLAVTADCFNSLIKLLRWGWQSFTTNILELNTAGAHAMDSLLVDLRHLTYVCCASLHLLKVYVNEVFPNPKKKQFSSYDSVKLAECVANTRTMMKVILLGSHSTKGHTSVSSNNECEKIAELLFKQILNECQASFVSCYHAFYPSTALRWRGLCDLLLTPSSEFGDHQTTDSLLAAMLASLCSPLIRLTLTFPLNQSLDVQSLSSPSDLTSPTSAIALNTDIATGQDPVLMEKMLEKSDREGCHTGLECSFRDVLIKLLSIIGQPIECVLFKNRNPQQDLPRQSEDGDVASNRSSSIDSDEVVREVLENPPSLKLVQNACTLLSSVLSELVAQATGVGFDIQAPIGQSLYLTPSRFSRVSQNRTWNTGNGSPDAICFSVDRSGILISGVAVYGGQGNEWHYELELLDYQGAAADGIERPPGADGVQGHQWLAIDIARGTYTLDEKSPEMAEIKFDKPIAIRENVKYALRLRNHGARTNNGDGGLTQVRGPDGTNFTFSDCSLSFNGTNHTRGQIPQIMYYSAPVSSRTNQTCNSSTTRADEVQSRRNVLAISDSIVSLAVDLLYQAQGLQSRDAIVALSSSMLITQLLPAVMANLAPIATSNPKNATHILMLIKQLLPLVARLVKGLDLADLLSNASPLSSPPPSPSSKNIVTTSKQYILVESDHPYKPASVSNYRVIFPASVKWMSLEFDPRCGTAQPEDALQLMIPSTKRQLLARSASKNGSLIKQEALDLTSGDYWPVFRKFSGKSGNNNCWPSSCLVLPGNEIVFSLETASDYLKDEKASYYGFRCQLVGYEYPSGDFIGGLSHLEQELSYLGATCVNTLLSRDLVLPAIGEECAGYEQEAARHFSAHSTILGKGLSLAHLPTAIEALEGVLALSHEKPFLKDFVNCTPGTSGGRLARWLQPESYADPNQCEVHCMGTSLSDQGLQCGWPTMITITTKDQYGEVVNVPGLRVEVCAQPFHTNTSTNSMSGGGSCLNDGNKSPKLSKLEENVNMTFGGLPPPQTIPYNVTMKDKMLYHAITMMPAHENYSFEELRFVAPVKRRSVEAMLVRTNCDGTYTANWTPGSVGWYQVKVMVDGVPIASCQSVQVREAPKDVSLPQPLAQNKATAAASQKSMQTGKNRKFVGRNSAGLRIRALPSLQSEQIGVVAPGSMVSVLEELQNDDGIWVRLSPSCIFKHCHMYPVSGYPTASMSEAWCLQYNQHVGKILLLPVDEEAEVQPLPIVNGSSSNSTSAFREVSGSSSSKTRPNYKKAAANASYTYPAMLHVVKSGNSGHNVRSKPTLRAPPVGMLVLGNIVTVVQELQNMDGLWFKLSEDSRRRFCFNVDGDAWTLGSSEGDVVYLQHEAETMAIVASDESDSEEVAKLPTKQAFPVRAQPSTESKQPESLRESLNSVMQALDSSCSAREMSNQTLSQSVASESEIGSIGSSVNEAVSVTHSSSMHAEPEKTESESVMSSTSSVISAGSKVAAYKKMFSDSITAIGASVGQGKGKEQFNSLGVNVKEMVRSLSRESSPTPPGTPPATPKVARSVSPTSFFQKRPSLQSASRSLREFSRRRTTSSSDVASPSSSATMPLTPFKPSEEVHAIKQMSQKSTQTSPPTETVAPMTVAVPNSLTCSMPSVDTFSSEPVQAVPSPTKRPPRHSRSKRERPSSPQGLLQQQHSPLVPGVQASANLPKPLPASRVPVKEAMSNSIAECLRAVFAAFIWHEGILHDAMAAASYLKFSRSMSKDVIYGHFRAAPQGATSKSMSNQPPSISREQKAKYRHSVEVSQLKTLQVNECYVNANIEVNKPITEVDNNVDAGKANKDIENENEVSKPSSSSQTHQAQVTEAEKGSAQQPESDAEAEGFSLDQPNVPETLIHLLYLWEQVSKACGLALSQPVVAAAALTPVNDSPATTPVQMFSRIMPGKQPNQVSVEPIQGNEKQLQALSVANPNQQWPANNFGLYGQLKNMIRVRVQEGMLPPRFRGLANKFGVAQVNMFGEAAAFANGIANGQAGQLEQRDGTTECELCGVNYPYPVTRHMRRAHPGCGEHAGGKGYNSSGSFCGGWAGHCGDGGVGSSNWYLICDRCREKYLSQKRTNGRSSKSQRKEDLKFNGMKSFHSPVTPRMTSPTCALDVHQIMKENALFLLRLASASEPSNSITEAAYSSKGRQSSEFACSSLTFECIEALGIHHNIYKQRLAEENLTEDEIRAIQTGRPSQSEDTGSGSNARRSEEKSSDNNSPTPVAKGSDFHRSVSIGWSPADQSKERVLLTPRKRATSTDSSSPLLCQPSAALIRLVEVAERSPPLISQASVQSNTVHYSSRQSSQDSSSRPPSSVQLQKQASFQACFPANRPAMAFVTQQHDLQLLTATIKNAIRKVACRSYALQALTWLLRNVTQPTGLHDLMWAFVASLSIREEKTEGDEAVAGSCGQSAAPNVDGGNRRDGDADHAYHSHGSVCTHPASDLAVAGDALKPLQEAFHGFLQTVSDIMPLLPVASPLQQIAIRCFCLHFEAVDHAFLHRGHVFSNISKILSRTDEEQGGSDDIAFGVGSSSPQRGQQVLVEVLVDVTAAMEMKASSRQAMIGSLIDNSTETFWESGDEDRNKTKAITATSAMQNTHLKVVYIHVDNCRDLGSKISQVSFKVADSGEGPSTKIKTCDVDVRFAGWLSVLLPGPKVKTVKIELKGPDNTLRLRQVKILGVDGPKKANRKPTPNYSQIQQINCEAETLRVFRLLTSQVFGKLILVGESDLMDNRLDLTASQEPEQAGAAAVPSNGDSNDLREHMVGILFSRSSKLSHLQKQVCSHIVQAIRVEALRLREEWEALLCSKVSVAHATNEIPSDAYCFEMLSMVLALSGSSIGRLYLSQQNELLLDLFCLLHTGSARVQRQVTSLLRRVLPDIEPASLAKLLNVKDLPPNDYVVAANNKDIPFDVQDTGLLDVFLACVAKSLTVQSKVKGSFGGASSKNVTTVTLATAIHPRDSLRDRWWLRGCMSRKLAEVIISLVKDMASGKLSDSWASVTRNAIADNILNLTRLSEQYRSPNECLKTPTLWLGLASLCVLDQEHAERLSSSHWVASAAGDQANGNQPQQPTRPLCDNHDDNETLAIILCSVCGNLCADCDRFLHLHRKTKAHQRQIFKEEEEAIKVDLHEGCGRTKLFWLMALADSKTLKAMVEFRGESSRTKSISFGAQNSSPSGLATGICRFCGNSGNTGLLAIGNVCSEPECQEHAHNACQKTLACGHLCGGVRDEASCLPCLHGCTSSELKQDADDMCMICFTEALSCAPAVQLKCGHLFHLHCCAAVLKNRWPGPRIFFAFSLCPICKAPIEHPALDVLLAPVRGLYEDVKRKALMRLEYEGLHRSEAITTSGARFYQDPTGYSMERYAYYVCCKCEKAYYGGEARCDAEAGIGDDYDPNELVCGGCSDVSRAQMCPKHGTDFLEYKCRYCCSVAVFFCFGTTHFCNACHDDFQRVTNIPKTDLPRCPAGARAKQLEGEECPLHVKHPPTGEEFALGCGVCRNAHTF